MLQIFAKIEHGQARFNASQVREKQERFTKEEYEAFKAQHKREDEANIAAAEKEYQRLVAQDAKEQESAKAPPKQEHKDWFSGFGAWGAAGAEESSSSSWLNPFSGGLVFPSCTFHTWPCAHNAERLNPAEAADTHAEREGREERETKR